jgi:hypothetical protein
MKQRDPLGERVTAGGVRMRGSAGYFQPSGADSTNSRVQTPMLGVPELDQKDARLRTRYGSQWRLAVGARKWKPKNRKGAALGSRTQFRFSKFRLRSSEAGNGQLTIANKSRFLRLRLRTGLCLAAFVVLCLSCRSSIYQGAGLPLIELHGGLDPLRNAFNKDLGKVRLMLLLDPT